MRTEPKNEFGLSAWKLKKIQKKIIFCIVLDEDLKTNRPFAISTEDAGQGFGTLKRSCMLHVEPCKRVRD